MNIAFCDDNKYLLDELCNKVKLIIDDNKYLLDELCNKVKLIIDDKNNHNFNFSYFKFSSPIELIHEHKNKMFDIVFLDIRMPELNGLEVGDLLYQINNSTMILYTTSYREFMPHTIEHRVYRFIEKGDENALERAVISALNDLYMLNSRYVFAYNSATFSLPMKNILYIEVKHNTSTIYTDNEHYKQNCSLKSILSKLPDHFIRCHTAYIINIKRVKKITKNFIILDNNSIIPIGNKYRFNIKLF